MGSVVDNIRYRDSALVYFTEFMFLFNIPVQSVQHTPKIFINATQYICKCERLTSVVRSTSLK